VQSEFNRYLEAALADFLAQKEQQGSLAHCPSCNFKFDVDVHTAASRNKEMEFLRKYTYYIFVILLSFNILSKVNGFERTSSSSVRSIAPSC
jgi:hypothetical protein